MVAAFLTVLIIFSTLFAIVRMIQYRNEHIAIRSGIIVLLGMIILTFINSLISGGAQRLTEMVQFNLIASAFTAIVIWFLFFWKQNDLYYYLDENQILVAKSKEFSFKTHDELVIEESVEYEDEDFAAWREQQKQNQSERKAEFQARLQKDYDLAKDVEFKPANFEFERKEEDKS